MTTKKQLEEAIIYVLDVHEFCEYPSRKCEHNHRYNSSCEIPSMAVLMGQKLCEGCQKRMELCNLVGRDPDD